MGLNHTSWLLKFLNNPQDNFKTIHLAGTNGKGSTAAIINSILIANGYKVGLYTSPHLISFNERIRVNGITITDEEIISFMKHVEPAINEIKSTFFEVTTAMAFYHFNNNDVDVAIIETGLGGRLDSTNVVNPSLTVMTPISLDHRDILGHTIEKIAEEKAGIIKRGVPLITVLFMSSVMFPMFLPEDMFIEKLVRVIIAISLFEAAYVAEVIRGGLQALPRGQYDAAKSLGMGYWKMHIFVILPQALKLVIPGIANTFLALVKDTPLIFVVGLLEIVGMLNLAKTNPEWLGFAMEGYVFASIVFFIICYAMSKYSYNLEQKYKTER